MTDAEGRITYFNEAAAELWGRRPEPGTRWFGAVRLYRRDGSPLPPDESPMAIALEEGRPVRSAELIAERPDGARVAILSSPTPLRDETGRITGAITVLTDVSDLHKSEENVARLAAIVASSDDAIISKTLDGRIRSWNESAARMFGYDAGEMLGESVSRIIPPELEGEEADILARLARGEHVEHYETVRIARDGRRIHVSLSVSPMRDGGGRVIGAAKVARDITERKKAEELERLLRDELTHRIKNTLATVQAIATQTLRHSRRPRDFVATFNGRIQALAKAHSLLTLSNIRGAELSEIARDQLVTDADRDRIFLSGPPVVLDAQATVSLALVLHELGSNARKYGALSVPHGTASADWSVSGGSERTLSLQWREQGGPPVRAPRRRGFGTTLIEQSLRALGGEAVIRYVPDGLTCRISLSLADRPNPLADLLEATGEAAPRREEAATPAPPAGTRVIIIEDETLIALDVTHMLGDRGFEVVGQASSVDEARRLIDDAAFDVALLDGNLGGERVDDLARALSEKGAPFVFISGYGRRALPADFPEIPIVEKPFNEQQLLAAIGSVLPREEVVVAMKPDPA